VFSRSEDELSSNAFVSQEQRWTRLKALTQRSQSRILLSTFFVFQHVFKFQRYLRSQRLTLCRRALIIFHGPRQNVHSKRARRQKYARIFFPAFQSATHFKAQVAAKPHLLTVVKIIRFWPGSDIITRHVFSNSECSRSSTIPVDDIAQFN
jgi:hypothetical protein